MRKVVVININGCNCGILAGGNSRSRKRNAIATSLTNMLGVNIYHFVEAGINSDCECKCGSVGQYHRLRNNDQTMGLVCTSHRSSISSDFVGHAQDMPCQMERMSPIIRWMIGNQFYSERAMGKLDCLQKLVVMSC